MTKAYYSYEEYKQDLKTLTQQIDQSFDAILGIARGGLFMAKMLISITLKRKYNIQKTKSTQKKRDGNILAHIRKL